MTWPVPAPRAARSSEVPGGEDGPGGDLINRGHAGPGPRPQPAQAAGQRRNDPLRQKVDHQEEQPGVSEEVELTGPETVSKILLCGADQGRADDRAPQG